MAPAAPLTQPSSLSARIGILRAGILGVLHTTAAYSTHAAAQQKRVEEIGLVSASALRHTLSRLREPQPPAEKGLQGAGGFLRSLHPGRLALRAHQRKPDAEDAVSGEYTKGH